MILKNKTGAEKILSVYWFAILVLVAGAIVFMVSIFYGNPYDVREIETGILANNIADCLSENGNLKYELDSNLKDNFLEICNLNFENDKDEYYVEVEFYNFDNPENPLDFKIIEGNVNLKTFNKIAGASKSVFKSEKSFYVLNKKEKGKYKLPKELIVKINSIIRKTEKNVQ